MRKLTDKELTLISGGDLTTIVVTADPPSGGDGGGLPPSGGGGGGGGGVIGGGSGPLSPDAVTVHQNGSVVTIQSSWTVGDDHFTVSLSDDLNSHNISWAGSDTIGSNTVNYSDSTQGDPTLGFSHSFNLPDNIQFNLGVSYNATSGYGVNGTVVVPF